MRRGGNAAIRSHSKRDRLRPVVFFFATGFAKVVRRPAAPVAGYPSRMKIALTGGTGFIGRYIANELLRGGHQVRAWSRSTPSDDGYDGPVEWIAGSLDDPEAAARLVDGCDGLIHAALWRPGDGFRGAEGDVVEFTATNVLGTLRLLRAAVEHRLQRVVAFSTCAVHESILDDRPLDETHPLWPHSHYGAHKAAIEAYVHSFAHAEDLAVCALRPSGVYGLARPARQSKWFELVQRVSAGERIEVSGGGKEVHAADVAAAAADLLTVDRARMQGEAFSCCDRYISRHEVATIARELSGSDATIAGEPKSPKHQIDTSKLQSLGFEFGGTERLRATIAELLAAA